jgi:hypothetical protein
MRDAGDLFHPYAATITRNRAREEQPCAENTIDDISRAFQKMQHAAVDTAGLLEYVSWRVLRIGIAKRFAGWST